MKDKSTISLLAFIALIISGVIYLLSLLEVGSGILPLIKEGILLFVVLVSAWNFASRLSTTWKVVYAILAILVIVGFIFNTGIKL